MGEPTAPGPAAATTTAGTRSRAQLTGPRSIVLLVLLTVILGAAQLIGFLSDSGDAAAEVTSSTTASRTVTEYPPGSRGAPIGLAGTGLTGEAIDITSWRGDVIVINVWGSWCAPCRQEAPILAATSRAYAGDGVQFLGVNVRDNPAAASAFEESYGITYPSIDDNDGKALLSLTEHLPGSGVPVTLILDREGRPAARVLGAVQEATLTALLDTILAEQGGEPS